MVKIKGNAHQIIMTLENKEDIELNSLVKNVKTCQAIRKLLDFALRKHAYTNM